jgi:hypothetical protein
MLFIARWTALPEVEKTASERFVKTGGAPPEGINMLGRWHSVGAVAGVAVCECSDIEPLATWVHEWADLLSFEITPALTDEQLGKILSTALAQG